MEAIKTVIETCVSSISSFFNTLNTNLTNWFSNLFTNLGNWFSNLGSSIGGFFSTLGTNLGNWFTSLFTNLGNILSYINPFSDNFLGKKIIELLGDLLRYLFVPDREHIDGLSNSVTSKFAFVDTINESVNAIRNMLNNVEGAPSLQTTPVQSKYYNGRLTVIDLSWYAPFKNYGDLVITGFCYLFFVWRVFVNATHILNSTSSGVSVVSGKGGKEE